MRKSGPQQPFVGLGRLSRTQVLATVFCLFTMAVSQSFAIAQGEKVAKQELEQTVGPLVQQILGMDIGEIVLDKHEGSITLTRPEGTYVFFFEDFSSLASTKAPPSELPLTVKVYDAGDNWMQTVTFNGIRVVDDNRIDFEAGVLNAADEKDYHVSGSVAGLRNETAKAVAMLDVTGQTQLVSVDYGGISGNSLQSPTNPVTLTPMDSVTSEDAINGPAILPIEPAEWVVAGAIIVLIVLFVCVTCLVFGWWGC